MISTLDRIEAIRLIDEATTSGASLMRACKEIGITDRTYFRWIKLKKQTGSYEDLRPNSVHPEPANKLTAVEEQQILDVIKQVEFVDYPPCEIIPILADRGIYIASESTFYRVLHKNKMQHHRGRAKVSKNKALSTHFAIAPNQVWMWDITYLNGPIKGRFYYLYLISDLFSRKIVGWEIWTEESAEHASE